MSLVKPNLQTRFHIDFDWWQQNENDWRVHLAGLLCPEHKAMFAEMQDGALIDFVDPETAEVRPMDGLQQVILSHCARQPGFVTGQTQLVEGVFRTFLANGNSPLTPTELSEKLGRPANTILVTLSGPRVYRGIRPAKE
ncbi:MAG: hypothetical protein Fur0016_20630 [Anaerolineales bacterium]